MCGLMIIVVKVRLKSADIKEIDTQQVLVKKI
jgi:hypothetical protein